MSFSSPVLFSVRFSRLDRKSNSDMVLVSSFLSFLFDGSDVLLTFFFPFTCQELTKIKGELATPNTRNLVLMHAVHVICVFPLSCLS